MYPHMTSLNITMQWVLAATFVVLVISLLLGEFSGKRLFYSLLLSCLLLVGCLAIGSFGKEALKVDCLNGETFVSVSKPASRLVIFDDSYDLKSATALMKKT